MQEMNAVFMMIHPVLETFITEPIHASVIALDEHYVATQPAFVFVFFSLFFFFLFCFLLFIRLKIFSCPSRGMTGKLSTNNKVVCKGLKPYKPSPSANLVPVSGKAFHSCLE